MIPRVIHQTWKDKILPVPKEWPESWRLHNPGWDHRIWTDDDLLQLVRHHYPSLEPLYQSYSSQIQRADLGRYLILHHSGGIYADIDTDCISSAEMLHNESRVILCCEPSEQIDLATAHGLDHLLFNGVMASPRGHDFWEHVIRVAQRSRHADPLVLESTGPLMLTGAAQSYPHPEMLSINSCHLFTPAMSTGTDSADPIYGEHAQLRISRHHWRGSWFEYGKKRRGIRRLKDRFRKLRYHLMRGPFLTKEEIAATIDTDTLVQPVQASDDKVLILIPVRDAGPFLDRCFELLHRLDYPRNKMRVIFCEGDSKDDTVARLQSLVARYSGDFAELRVIHLSTGLPIARAKRSKRKLQKRRRAALAKVRNHLIDAGLTDQDDWVLWIDADVCDYPADILKRLVGEKEKVITPDCRRETGGRSFDLNSFLECRETKANPYYKYVSRGLFMPPADFERRRHLHTMRFLERVPLSAVGGTMLLVHASVHRAGLRFPEIPYDDLLETEAFGRMCRDLGVTPIGLPNIEILHVMT